jgi:hypothetical protein
VGVEWLELENVLTAHLYWRKQLLLLMLSTNKTPQQRLSLNSNALTYQPTAISIHPEQKILVRYVTPMLKIGRVDWSFRLIEPLVVDLKGVLLAGGHRLAAFNYLRKLIRTYQQQFPDDLFPCELWLLMLRQNRSDRYSGVGGE